MTSLRNSVPKRWVPKGCSDATDGTNAFAGAMTNLVNLIPSPNTAGQFVPRPGAPQLTDFTGFSTPAGVTALLVIGDIAYGMISSAAFAGKDQPFAYDLVGGTFQTISGQLAANLPTTQATTGDWTPPTMAQVGTRIMVTHPGFPGGTVKVGWLDISGFSSSSITGNTHSNTTLDTLSSNPITAGWKPGMAVSSSAGDIPAGTTIVSLTAAAIVLSQAATGTNAITVTVTGGGTSTPQWGAGDTNTNNLSAVPKSVRQFSGRAYYAVSNGVQLSDAGNPTQITNATQALTMQNGLTVTALGTLGLQTLDGGIVQSLIAFQGASEMWQIAGDPTTSDLTLNSLNLATGTLAPNTICNTPLGLAFIAPDGLRFLDQNAKVSEPIGNFGQGVNKPFLYAVNPSRMVMAYNRDVLRVTVVNGDPDVGSTPTQDWWLHLSNKGWTGPHTCGCSMIAPWRGASQSFVGALSGTTAKLFRSDVQVSSSSSYTENGASLSWTFGTVLLPDNDAMAANAMIEASIAISLPGQQQATVQVINDRNDILDTVYLTGAGQTPAIWGAFIWGAGIWGATGRLYQQSLDWTEPLIFKQASITITGTSIGGIVLGNLYLRFETLGYMLEGVA